MNKKQKVLTRLMLLVFVLIGLVYFASPSVSLAGALTACFASAVSYAGLLILLRF